MVSAFVGVAVVGLTSGETMTERSFFVRRDFLALLGYLGVVVLALVVEVKLTAPRIAMAAYLVASASYLAAVVMIHRLPQRSNVVANSRLAFGGTCAAFVVVGLVVGLIVGVNAKFLLGGKL